jgi:hypothetical protein
MAFATRPVTASHALDEQAATHLTNIASFFSYLSVFVNVKTHQVM